MQKDAIQHIEQGAVAAKLAANLHDMALPVVPVPDAYKLISIEKFLDQPARFRGTFRTDYINEFTAYMLKNIVNSSTAGVFINAQKMTATGILDLGDPTSPKHAEHRAVVKIIPLNAYTALRAMNGVKKSQREFAEWMEDWRDYLEAYTDMGPGITQSENGKIKAEGGNEIDLKAAIAAVRKITLKVTAANEHSTQDFKAARSALEEIEAFSKDLSLPGSLYFTCKPYEELQTRTFVCRVGVLTSEKEPTIVLRVAQMEAHVEEMGKEFQALVQKPLAESAVQVRLGEFETA